MGEELRTICPNTGCSIPESGFVVTQPQSLADLQARIGSPSALNHLDTRSKLGFVGKPSNLIVRSDVVQTLIPSPICRTEVQRKIENSGPGQGRTEELWTVSYLKVRMYCR